MERQKVINFIVAVLDDEHGISTEAWDVLGELRDSCTGCYWDAQFAQILNQVKASDGRYYLPKVEPS